MALMMVATPMLATDRSSSSGLAIVLLGVDRRRRNARCVGRSRMDLWTARGLFALSMPLRLRLLLLLMMMVMLV